MNQAPAVYLPVPVDAARQIGFAFRKSVVVIIALDDAHQLSHTATWGDTADNKSLAARLGDHLTQAAGMDLARAMYFEDYRTRGAAESAAIIDRLTRERDELARQLALVTKPKEGGDHAAL